jgi:hypothetical protein
VHIHLAPALALADLFFKGYLKGYTAVLWRIHERHRTRNNVQVPMVNAPEFLTVLQEPNKRLLADC